jgi:dTMP kinase
MSVLISFEGLDGSGKSTQVHLLADRLRLAGHRVEVLREPGGTDVSERIRTLLLDPGLAVDPFAELLLFSAARAQLCQERIRPLLNAGTVVLLDRFFDSTTAYQGGGRQIADVEWLTEFHRRVTGGLIPDRTYLLDLNETAAANRQDARDAGQGDRMERSGRAFYGRVGEAYRELARRDSARFMVMEAAQSIDVIHAAIWDDTAALLGTADSSLGID